MGYQDNLSNKSLGQRYEDYDVFGTGKEIHKVVIDGNEFSGYKSFTFLWEKSYVKEPTRSGSGVIGNLNSYATFVTPHLKIDFSVMPIEDYRKLYKLLLSKNEFQVTCYDVINNNRTTNKMYFATDQFPTLYAVAREIQLNGENKTFIELNGVRDYTVELIGTNNEIDKVSIVYNSNYPSGSNNKTEGADKEYYVGEEVKIGDGIEIPNNPPNGYKFSHWVAENVNGDEEVFYNGTMFTVSDLYRNGLTLKAQWQSSKIHTLHFNYGLADIVTKTDPTTGVTEQITDREVQKDVSIGTLPLVTSSPSVEYNKTKYYPYIDGAWYKGDSTDNKIVNNNDDYWLDYNTTIFYLYKVNEYSINFVIEKSNYEIPIATYGYNEKVVLPRLGDVGEEKFAGWYLDSDGTTPFASGSTMPPCAITLYAKWEK